LAIFTFRGDKYNSDILNKVSSEGHLLPVAKELIVPAPIGVATAKPIAIKVDGKYCLLQGHIDTKHNQPTILCITKHTLKKCKVDKPVTVNKNEQNQSHQAAWNNRYYNERTNDSYSGRGNNAY
jgi:hypothetical protein